MKRNKKQQKREERMTTKVFKNQDILGLVLFVGVLFLVQNAWAFTEPAAGSFAFDIFDIGVNKILKGPIGFVGGVSAIVMGGIFAVQAKIMQAVPAILGGATILKADSIVTSLGFMF
jgi:hypothetical protein